MTIKPSDHGIVVEDKETGLRSASLDQHYDPATMRKVRDLRPGETVLSYQPRHKSDLGGGDEDDSDTSTAGTASAVPVKKEGN